jgi:hypothetical protein
LTGGIHWMSLVAKFELIAMTQDFFDCPFYYNRRSRDKMR